MIDALARLRFRKKYSLAVALFIAGTVQAFAFKWSAGEYTAFAALLLGIFGTADLFDKKMPNQ